MSEHDGAYKYLFSHPEMVQGLLEGWIAEYVPNLRYFLLNERRGQSIDSKEANPMATVIDFENAETPQEIQCLIERTIENFKGPRYASLRRAWSVWLRRVLTTRMANNAGKVKLDFESLEGARVMLAERVEQWMLDPRQKARQEARQKAKATPYAKFSPSVTAPATTKLASKAQLGAVRPMAGPCFGCRQP